MQHAGWHDLGRLDGGGVPHRCGRWRHGHGVRAKNPTLPRRDALKVLSAEVSGDHAFRERFIREADIVSQFDHPNIVSIYGRGETVDGQLWIALQYVAGC